LKRLAEVLEADRVRFLPWQPYERRGEPISAAHLHVVGLARGLAGYIVPSRMWGVLAAGRPVIAAAEDESETAAVVRETGCGIVVPPGDPLRLAEAIRACYDGVYDLEEMGRRARAFAEVETDRTIAVDRYRAVLEELRGSR
jgi:glycosyltransferase involved in cell wall biosynthesis